VLVGIMNRIKIGVRLESLDLPFRKALAAAARLGVSGVQFDPVGDLSPGTLSTTGRREVRHLLRTYNLELTALGCPLRRGLDVVEQQQERLEYVRQVMALAWELGTRIVIVQAGEIPEKEDDPRRTHLRESLLLLGQHADRMGVRLALETGLEPGRRLADFLGTLDTGGVGVNLDAGNLLMHGHDLTEAVRALHRLILHAHAKDARRATANRMAQEVPLGHGDIDWIAFLGSLEEIEYHGWLVVERESGTDLAAETAHGVGFLRKLLGVGD
jgi:sugar phosphate isomerase/epimerase